MTRVLAIESSNNLALLSVLGIDIDAKIMSDGVGSKPSDEISSDLIKSLASVKNFCKLFELKNSFARTKNFISEMERNRMFNIAIKQEIIGLENSICDELKSCYCAFIEKENLKFFEKDRLFGDVVYRNFKEIREEIKDAGNCMAADLHTAAIFHLMRVAEYGLRKLSKPFNIQLTYQIEFATWGKVLAAIQGEMDKKRGSPSKSKDKKIKRYSQLVLDIKSFMHLWRNPVSHFRGRYGRLEAESAFNHVRSFMRALCVK